MNVDKKNISQQLEPIPFEMEIEPGVFITNYWVPVPPPQPSTCSICGVEYKSSGRVCGRCKKHTDKRTTKAKVWKKSDGKCWYCGVQTEPFTNFVIDHFQPISKGGGNQIENLVPSCSTCNLSKGKKTIDEYREHCKRIEGEDNLDFYFEHI